MWKNCTIFKSIGEIYQDKLKSPCCLETEGRTEGRKYTLISKLWQSVLNGLRCPRKSSLDVYHLVSPTTSSLCPAIILKTRIPRKVGKSNVGNSLIADIRLTVRFVPEADVQGIMLQLMLKVRLTPFQVC